MCPSRVHCVLEGHSPSCALQLSMVLSRLSWNLLRIWRLGEMSCTGVLCCCTDSLSSFRSISALLRSAKRNTNQEKDLTKRTEITIQIKHDSPKSNADNLEHTALFVVIMGYIITLKGVYYKKWIFPLFTHKTQASIMGTFSPSM